LTFAIQYKYRKIDVVRELNEAVVLLNDFIHYRNNKFKPTFSDEETSRMIEIPKAKLTKCQNDIYSVGSVGDQNAANVSIKKINKLLWHKPKNIRCL
jgi:hypothetical protein